MIRRFVSPLVRERPFLCSRKLSSFLNPTKAFTVKPENQSASNSDDDGSYLNPDWYRDPQPSDGPRCIMPGYPEPPFQSYQNRDPYKYSDKQGRRNFGEPVHEQFDILSSQSFDVEKTYSMTYMLTGVGIAAAAFFGIIQLCNMVDDKDGWRRDASAREFPYLHKYQPKDIVPVKEQ